mgnify:CR=1 FL=1
MLFVGLEPAHDGLQLLHPLLQLCDLSLCHIQGVGAHELGVGRLMATGRATLFLRARGKTSHGGIEEKKVVY